MPLRIPLVGAVAIAVATASLAAQDHAPLPRSFEVASIKPNKSGDAAVRVETSPGGRFIATNISLRSLLRLAYGVDDEQIAGGPSWMNRDGFDVRAVAATELPPMNGPFGAGGALPELVKSLLTDRFGLMAHAEMREAEIYLLVVAREDRRLGDGLQRSAIDCAALFAQRRPDAPSPSCGMRIAPGSITLAGVPIAQLASALSAIVRRPVVDRTGLAGTYDLELHWQMQPPPSANAPPAAAPDGPTLATALQDAAGLRLERTRAPQQVLVVDAAHQPSRD